VQDPWPEPTRSQCRRTEPSLQSDISFSTEHLPLPEEENSGWQRPPGTSVPKLKATQVRQVPWLPGTSPASLGFHLLFWKMDGMAKTFPIPLSHPANVF
jgi:hypothetical protein